MVIFKYDIPDELKHRLRGVYEYKEGKITCI